MKQKFATMRCVAVALSVLALLASVAGAAERYKDRMFEVEVTKDWPIAQDVPHLSETHFITEALEKVSDVKGDGTVAYFYSSESKTKNKSILVDVYMPKKDTVTDRPMVIVSHGGAFVAGHKDDKSQKTVGYCDSLAARGYVVMSLEYRLGVTLEGKECPILDKTCQLSIDSANFARSVYRGVQDIRAAVRFARKNVESLGINPGRIYLIGNSAGAILSLENIYASSEKDFPSYIEKEPLLGALDEYGEPGTDSRANGAASLWGAVHNLDMIGDNETPVLLIHGTDDGTVYFKTGRPLSNVAGVLTNLMPSTAASIAAIGLDLHAPTLYGSYVIDSLLTAKKIEHETYFVEGVKHEFYDDDPKYAKEVQKRVFDFLYNLTQGPAGVVKNPAVMLTRAAAVHMGENNLSFSVSRGSNLKYVVVDLRGRAVMNGVASAGNTVELNVLNNGVYVLKVQGERAIKFGIRK